MKIVVATRCLNGLRYIERFLRGYNFADHVIVSDGGSTDGSVELFSQNKKVTVVPFTLQDVINGYIWNPDNLHIQHAIDEAKRLDPTWLILDDLDDVPNAYLRRFARELCSKSMLVAPQINAFRLYLWGEQQYFPKMNNDFDPAYTSLWAWRPDKVDVRTDMNQRHGTLIGLSDVAWNLSIPHCLLHKSWDPETIQAKLDRYNAIGLPMNHPFTFAGELKDLPEWATE